MTNFMNKTKNADELRQINEASIAYKTEFSRIQQIAEDMRLNEKYGLTCRKIADRYLLNFDDKASNETVLLRLAEEIMPKYLDARLRLLEAAQERLTRLVNSSVLPAQYIGEVKEIILAAADSLVFQNAESAWKDCCFQIEIQIEGLLYQQEDRMARSDKFDVTEEIKALLRQMTSLVLEFAACSNEQKGFTR